MRALGLLGTVVAVAAGGTSLTSCGGASVEDRAAVAAALREWASADAATDGSRVCAVLSRAAAGAVGSGTRGGRRVDGSCVRRYAAEVRRLPFLHGPDALAGQVRDAARRDDALTVETDGDTATVAIDGIDGSDAGRFRLRREDGAWRIDRIPETATLR